MGNKGRKKLHFLLIICLIGAISLSFIFDIWGVRKDSSPYIISKAAPIKSSRGFGVSANSPEAVKIGMEVMEKGGNAIDAAIAVSYALGVTEPYGSGIGGGGEMVVLEAGSHTPKVYDYRETAPILGQIPDSYAGIPGLVKGLEVIHAELGMMDMEDLISPSIDLAEKGFVVDKGLTDRLTNAQYRMPVQSIEHFYPGGKPIQPGSILKQPELAETMKAIANEGSYAFYNGRIAQKILAKVRSYEPSDLKSYSIEKMDAVYGKFGDFEVISAPPPLSGVTLIQSLQMAEMLNINSIEENSADYVHLIGQIGNTTFKDRLTSFADPFFVNVDTQNLSSLKYSQKLAEEVSLTKLSPDYEVNESYADEAEHQNTTHFVVVDKDGTMVSATHSLSDFFGSGKYVGGFFLNNQLRNFSKTANKVNSAEPGKRPRSYTSPTILRSNKSVIGIGSPGGKRIPTVLTQVLIRYLIYDKPLQQAIDAPRFYMEGKTIYVEPGFSRNVLNELRSKGYRVLEKDSPIFFGGVQALVVDIDNNLFLGGADWRRDGHWHVAE